MSTEKKYYNPKSRSNKIKHKGKKVKGKTETGEINILAQVNKPGAQFFEKLRKWTINQCNLKRGQPKEIMGKIRCTSPHTPYQNKHIVIR